MLKFFKKAISFVLTIAMTCTAISALWQHMAEAYVTAQAEALALEEANLLSAAESLESVPYILHEEIEKRDAYTKHFRLSDGSFLAASYEEPVHFLQDGEWTDIDNSLVASENGYVNKTNSYQVEFQSAQNAAYTLEKDGYSIALTYVPNVSASSAVLHSQAKVPQISIQNGAEYLEFAVANAETAAEALLQGQTGITAEALLEAKQQQNALNLAQREDKLTAKKVTSQIEYQNVVGQTDIEYIIQPNSIKENIIIESASSSYQYTFALNAGSLTPELLEDGSIVLKNNEAEVIFTMPAPFMYDSNAERGISEAVFYTLTPQGNGLYTITLEADKEWINSSDTTFPVVIDPVVTVNGDSSNMEHGNVRDLDNTNNYIPNQLWVGYTGYPADSARVMRSYIRMKSLPEIGDGGVVVDAKLSLYQYTNAYFADSMPDHEIDVHEVLGSWSPSTLTWNNQPSYNSTILDYNTISRTNGVTRSWDITTAVKKWYDGRLDYNNGLLLKAAVESGTDNQRRACAAYYSEVYSGTAAQKPAIEITYRNQLGLEDYWSYLSFGAGRAGTVSVNNYTGNLVLVRDDASLSGNRMPVTIQHVYNSKFSGDMGFGRGWRLNYSQRLIWGYMNNDDYFRYVDADGTEHYLFRDPENTAEYIDEDGYGLRMTVNDADMVYRFTVTDKSNNSMVFDYYGLLQKIEDANGNQNTFTYNSSDNLTQITDGAGRNFTLSYANGHLSSITDPAGRSVTFEYSVEDGIYRLIKINDPDGYSVNYGYNSQNLINSVKNIDNYELNFAYTEGTDKKVTTIDEVGTGGISIDYSYAHNATEVQDSTGNSLTYQFDNYGRVTSVKDAEGYAQYSAYFSEGSKNNKINSASRLQRTVQNLLLNGSFEGSNSAVTMVGGAAASTADSLYGGKSLLITSSAQSTYQSVDLKPHTAYTASVYVNTKEMTAGSARISAVLGSQTYEQSLDEQTLEEVDGGWERISVTFKTASGNAANDAVIRLDAPSVSGNVYFDGWQLEEKESVNRFNLLENGDFSNGITGFTGVGTATGDGVVTLTEEDHPELLSNAVYKLAGDIRTDKQVKQTVQISGLAQDKLVFGAWAKGQSVKLSEKSGISTPAFEVQVKLYDGTYEIQTETLSFNYGTDQWQYLCGEVTAVNSYDSAVVILRYANNSGVAYFDGLQLYQERFGETYDYDEKGNLLQSSSMSQQASSGYTYDDDDNITRIDAGAEGAISYTYDENKNLLEAVSPDNVHSSYTYDSYGNVTSVKAGTNLIAYYTFDDKTLKEEITGQVKGTNSGGTWVNGRSGRGIALNGTNQFVELDVPDLGDSFSVSFWANVKKTNATQCVIGKHTSTGQNQTSFFITSDGLANIDMQGAETTGGSVVTGWRHYVLTSEKIEGDGGSSRVGKTRVMLYCDGILIAADELEKTTGSTGEGKNWILGADWDSSTIKNDWFEGEYDDIAFFDNVLSQEEVYALYQENDPSLMAYYPFDGGAYDASGNGNHGEEVNSPGYTYGVNGYAIHFNGTNQYVKLNDLETSRSFTVSFWVNPENTGDWRAMLGKHESTGKNLFMTGFYEGGFHVDLGAETYTISGEKWLGWQHIIFTVRYISDDVSEFSIYRNGVLLDKRTMSSKIGATDVKPWVLGAEYDNLSGGREAVLTDYFQGSFDELRFYSRAFSQEEAVKLYESERRAVAYYSFDNDTFEDDSRNNYNGTGVNSPSFAQGVSGNALSLNTGSTANQYVNLQDFSLGDSFTVTVEVCPAVDLASYDMVPVAKHTSAGGNQFVVGFSYGKYYLCINNATHTTQPIGILPNQWSNITVTVEKLSSSSTRVKLYENGTLKITWTPNAVLGNTTGKAWVIGQEWDGSVASDFFRGKIDEVGFYNYVMPAEDIQSLFDNPGSGNYNMGTALDTSMFENITATLATYTSDGNYLQSVTNEYGISTHYNWNTTKGLLNSMTVYGTEIDDEGQEVNYTYDANSDKLTSVSTTNGDDTITNQYTYEYDRLKSISHNGFQYNFTYDNLGRSDTVKVNNQTLAEYDYDANGNMDTLTYGNGDTVEYVYDQFQNVTGLKQNGTQQYSWSYNAQGLIGYYTDETLDKTLRYEYDSNERIKRITSSDGDKYLYDYLDEESAGVFRAYTNGDSYRTYTNSAGKYTEFSQGDEAADKASYSINDLGQITNRVIEAADGTFNVEYEYLQNNNENTDTLICQTGLVSAINTDSFDISYTYDENGNIKEIYRNGHKTNRFYYDDLGQLIREDYASNLTTILYTYDDGGNLIHKGYYSYLPNHNDSYGLPVNKEVSYTYDSQWKDLLVNYNGTAITYDEIGNPQNWRDGMSFSWTGRQLDSVTKDGVTTTYTYDSNGLRTSKTTGDDVTEYTYLGSSLVYQVTNKGQSDEVSLYFYYDDTGLAAFYYESAQYPSDNGIYHYVKDAQGNIWGIVDNKGTQIAKYEFSAYGEYRSRWSPEEVSSEELRRNNRVKSANPFDYRGYYYDEETGLYYCQSRYYDPEVDRWLNADDTDILFEDQESIIEHNLFAYCFNNPVNMIDDSGFIAWWIGAAISGALFDTAAYLIGCAITGEKVTWSGVGKAALSGAVTGVTFGAIGKGIKAVTTTLKATKVGVKIGTSFGKIGKLVKYRKITANWGKTTSYAFKRMSERGMSKSMVQGILRNGKVLQQTANKFVYITKKGAVVVESSGKIVTAYSSKYFDNTMKNIIKQLFG